MQSFEYTTIIDTSPDYMWNFIKDFNNWGPMIRGYQHHEIINDRESIWTIKGEFGHFSRMTKLHTTITEWIERDRVAFELTGLNEPVTGYGVVRLSSEDGGTRIVAEVGGQAGGAMGPIINRMIRPWMETIAEDLVVNLAEAVTIEKAEVRAEGKTIKTGSFCRNLYDRVYRFLVKILNKLFIKTPPTE